jgi:hypothetical protein
MFHTEAVDKVTAHISRSITSVQTLRRSCDKVEKYFRAVQATDEDIVQAHGMLGNYGYKYTLRIRNTY